MVAVILAELFDSCQSTAVNIGSDNLPIYYIREVLLSLRKDAKPKTSLLESLPQEIRLSQRRKKRPARRCPTAAEKERKQASTAIYDPLQREIATK